MPATYAVAVQEDEMADEHITGQTNDRTQAETALANTPYTRAYLVEKTATGWSPAR